MLVETLRIRGFPKGVGERSYSVLKKNQSKPFLKLGTNAITIRR